MVESRTVLLAAGGFAISEVTGITNFTGGAIEESAEGIAPGFGQGFDVIQGLVGAIRSQQTDFISQQGNLVSTFTESQSGLIGALEDQQELFGGITENLQTGGVDPFALGPGDFRGGIFDQTGPGGTGSSPGDISSTEIARRNLAGTGTLGSLAVGGSDAIQWLSEVPGGVTGFSGDAGYATGRAADLILSGDTSVNRDLFGGRTQAGDRVLPGGAGLLDYMNPLADDPLSNTAEDFVQPVEDFTRRGAEITNPINIASTGVDVGTDVAGSTGDFVGNNFTFDPDEGQVGEARDIISGFNPF